MQSPQIDYATAMPGQKRRRMMRRIAFGIVGLLVVVLAIQSAPPAWHHAQILYWQRQAMTYTAPGDRVVYDDSPKEAAALVSSDRSLQVGAKGEAFDFATPWDQFYRAESPPGRQPAATVFLHELVNSKGERRLVVIEEHTNLPPQIGGITPPLSQPGFQCVVFRPGNFLAEPQELYSSWMASGAASSSKWYAGQPDPQDASHFTIRGVIDGTPVIVDGWLRDDWLDLRSPR